MDSTVLDVKRCADFYPYYSMVIFREVFFVDKVSNNIFSSFTGTSNSANRFWMDYY